MLFLPSLTPNIEADLNKSIELSVQNSGRSFL